MQLISQTPGFLYFISESSKLPQQSQITKDRQEFLQVLAALLNVFFSCY